MGAEVVGVVVTAGEHIGAEDDAAFHLAAETLLSGAHVVVEQVAGVFGAVAVAHAVEAGEVRRGLGGGDDVVNSDRVLRVGQRDGDEFGPELFAELDGGLDFFADALVHAIDEILGGDAELHAFQVTAEIRGEILGRDIERGGVVRVFSGNGVEDRGAIAGATADGADLIERGGKGHEAVARDAAVTGLEAHDAAERSGLADRAAGVAAERGKGFAGRDRGRRAAAGAAGNARGVPGIACFLIGGILG